MSSIASEARPAMSPEMEALKARLKATWMAGDYGHFARFLEPGALEFLARLQLQPGTSMLDVACGAGQIAIPAARAGIKATGIDIASNLIEQANQRAAAENLDARFEEGDAEALPYEDASFDTVVSLIGAMFAPRPDKVAAELVRVCRPGGKIVMANWTPEGHVGQMFKIIGRHVPPPPLMPSTMKWGDEATVRDRLGVGTTQVLVEKHLYPMRYPFGPNEVVEFFFTYYGPTNRALAALDSDGQAALRAELEQLWTTNNKAQDGTTNIQAEYLHVTAIRA
ncbi:MAG TPA: class I SAM-dependent methyltransferase [Noviherbaspirillum sp.]|jgi:SAM-dependent methyltransferase|uniref:class I SAM-dependent methyltransferase n=1 Tax=Noviherbaspirillum sp. TaxID=1926288 RepID=UPI002DDDBAD2|nr:class I SAM-dependent methyltransferase [Noviherbaspirillum sp.]HEV2608707.1 class I SAM-dependent methyltransferase [Noviherbaspirillum sp.]